MVLLVITEEKMMREKIYAVLPFKIPKTPAQHYNHRHVFLLKEIRKDGDAKINDQQRLHSRLEGGSGSKLDCGKITKHFNVLFPLNTKTTSL